MITIDKCGYQKMIMDMFGQGFGKRESCQVDQRVELNQVSIMHMSSILLTHFRAFSKLLEPWCRNWRLMDFEVCGVLSFDSIDLGLFATEAVKCWGDRSLRGTRTQ